MALKKVIVLDIESKPNELYPLWVRRGDSDFQPPIFHEIVCIAYAVLDREFKVEDIGITGLGTTEAEALRKISSLIDNETLVITWGGRRFDMPVITYRSMKHGIQTTWDKESDFRNRFRFTGHFDLQDHMMHHGASDRIKLDHAAALVGLPGKMGVVGADVANLVARNRLMDVGVYCVTDVVQTYIVFLRYAYTMGLASAEEVNSALESLEIFSRQAIEIADRDYFPRETNSCIGTGVSKILEACNWEALHVKE